MPKIRNIPFGYHMVNGKIVPHPEQSQIVHQIFDDYSAGISIFETVQNLQTCSIPYREKSCWNKNMVYRILGDVRYIGDKGFPAIIDSRQFSSVQALRNQNESGRINPTIQILRKKIVCAQCSARLLRHSHGRNRPLEWYCEECQIKIIGIKDSDIADRVELTADFLLQAPSESYLISLPREGTSIALARLLHEFGREISNPRSNPEMLQQLAQQIAQERYNLCDAGEICADNEWLISLIQKRKSEQLSKPQFIQQAIQEIQLSVSGQISVKLINDKIV